MADGGARFWSALWAWAADHDTLLGSLAGLSLLLFVGTLLAVPVLVARIPADYFSRPRRLPLPAPRHPLLRLLLLALKNIAGFLLLCAGIAMLVLPGQGLLTMLIGLLLMNFPGKYRLERWLVSRPKLLNAINWLRRRRGRPPLQAP